MTLLADKIESKYKSWTNTSKPSSASRVIGRKLKITGICLGFITLIIAGVIELVNGFNPKSNLDSIYQPVVEPNNGIKMDITKSNTTGNYKLAVSTGGKVNVSATYNYDIAFVNPADGMPARMTDSTTGSSVTLPSNTPTMSGYAFVGWCTTSVSAGSACMGTTYQPGASFPLSSGSTNNVTLYALWKEQTTFDNAFANAGKSKTGSYYRMDDMTTSICDAVKEHEVGTLVDTRGTSGTQTYTVAKLKDGKCWMTQNIRLAYGTSALEVSDGKGSTTTWTPEQATLTGSGTDCTNSSWSSDRSNPYSVTCNNTTNGVYYNWTAAIASNDSTNIVDMAYTSICPKGWKLPRNAEGAGSFYTLYQNYNSSSLMLSSPINFVLAGSYYNGKANSVGSNGSYWSSAKSSSSDARIMRLTSSSVSPQSMTSRSTGYSVRCVSI